MTDDGSWLVLRLQPASPEARGSLLGDRVAELGATLGAESWFFCDIPVDLCEIAFRVRSDRGTRNGSFAVERLISSGVVTRAEVVPRPSLLDPSLLPEARVPRVYPDLLCATSRRSSEVLGECVRAGRLAPDDLDVGREVAAIYGALVPERERATCAAMHARWLERVAGDRSAVPPVVASDVRPAAYDAYVRAFDEYIDTFAAENRAVVRAHVVARLAHIQAVTLFGPWAEDALIREAALVRALFSGTAADAVPERSRRGG